jgi:hypothetical protein
VTTPLPVDPMISGDPWALVATDISPLKLPAPVGANATAKLWLWLGASVSGTDKPEPLKQLPVTASWVIAMLPTLVLVNEMLCVALLPTDTSPKLMEDGLAESGPIGIGCMLPRPHDATNPCRPTIAATNTPPILDVILAIVVSFAPGGRRCLFVSSKAPRRVFRTEFEVRKPQRNGWNGRQPIHSCW